MNILQAIEAIKSGEVIRYTDKEDEVYFAFQTVLLPIGTKEIVYANLTDYNDCHLEEPLTLEKLIINTLHRICISAILSENFSVITIEDMLKECQKAWKEAQENDEDDDS